MIIWTTPALRKLQAVVDFVSRHDEGAAVRLAGRIERSTALLPRFPARGRLGRKRRTRELSVPGTSYVVVYRVAESGIEILAVFHAREDRPTSIEDS